MFRRQIKVTLGTKKSFDPSVIAESGTEIYTDGSKSDKGVGAAMLVRFDNRTFLSNQYRLPQHATIFQAEAFAIKKSQEWIRDNRIMIGNTNVPIYADTRSVLQSVNSRRPSKQICDLQNAIDEHTELIWVPGHENISGNEEANSLAQAAVESDLDIQFVPVSKSYTTSKLREQMYFIWSLNWQRNLKKLSPNTQWVQKLFPNIASFKHIWKHNRWTQATTSVYTGHNYLNYHRFKLKKASSPRCRCGESDETTEHYLLDCKLWDNIRSKFTFAKIKSRGIQTMYIAENPAEIHAFVFATARLTEKHNQFAN
mmetsp:Transcript_22993/g.29867  ORF Transcript_22993/g.29867 Transcript_22993/m.29867 type:complete len:312 (-) Transcript_22993:66-1001(-)